MPRTPNKITLLPPASSLLFLATTSLVLAVHPETKWDEGIDPACCAYPEHDPRDYNWPYSHFLYSEVIPDVVGSYVSMTSLNLTYAPAADGKDQSPAVVEYGRLIAPSRVATPPSVAFDLETDRDASTLHTLMMVDPDVPFRDAPTDGQWLHWLVYDIPGNDTARGRTLVEYTPPAPRACPADDDLCLREHRVTFILWEQQHGPLDLHAEDVAIPAHQANGRARYKARDFAARHRLGLHIGLNFFETYAEPKDGSFGAMPWWHVTDAASLAKLEHLVPTVQREGGAAAAKEASAARGAKGGGGKKRKRKKDEL